MCSPSSVVIFQNQVTLKRTCLAQWPRPDRRQTQVGVVHPQPRTHIPSQFCPLPHPLSGPRRFSRQWTAIFSRLVQSNERWIIFCHRSVHLRLCPSRCTVAATFTTPTTCRYQINFILRLNVHHIKCFLVNTVGI